MPVKLGYIFTVNMITLWLVLFIANCIPLSGDSGMDKFLTQKDNSDYVETYDEQKALKRDWYIGLFSQRLWETASGKKTIDSSELTQNSTFSLVFDEEKRREQKSEKLKRTSNIFSHISNKGLRSKRKISKTKKEHDILMEDITYGIFGSCYNVSIFSEEPFVMIDTCPLSARNLHDVHLCHSSRSMDEFHECSIDMELVPVSDNRGYIYKNIYCALCHGVTNVTTWEVELAYNSVSALHILEPEQSLTFLGNLKDASQCVPSVYPLKPKGLLLCKHFNYHLKHSHRYRFVQRTKEVQSKEYPLSFQILMNFGINGKGHVFFSTSAMAPVVEHPCADNEIYDPKLQECRHVVCKAGYLLVDRKCIPKTQKYDSFSESDLTDATRSEYPMQITYRINVTRANTLLIESPQACSEISISFAEMLNISTSRICNLEIHVLNSTSAKKATEIRRIAYAEHAISQTNHSDARCKIQADADISLEKYDLKLVTVEFSFALSPSRNKSANYSSNEAIKKKLLLEGSFNFAINGTEFHIDNSAKNTDVELDSWCTKGVKDQKFDGEFDVIVQFDKRSGQNMTGVYVPSTGKFYPPGMYDLWAWVSGQIGNISDVSTNMYAFVCDMPKIKNNECARFQIDSSKYKIILRNNSIILEDKRIIDMDAYEYVNEDSTDIQICVPESYFLIEPPPSASISFGCGDNYKNVLLAEGYLSFVLGITSIVVLTAVIVTYSTFEKLRNLPGLNTMSLTLTLCLGELLFITSGSIEQNNEWTCPVVGACLHFIFLASFFWMNVMSYDVFRTFANKCILTRVRKKRRYFPRYSLYAWGAPALIVGICCILDFTKYFPNVKIGYGGSSGNSESEDVVPSIVNETEISPNVVKLSQQKLGCWIQEPVAALVAFGLPMILILFANAVMFVRTIICIRSVTKLVSLSTRRSSVSNAIGHHDVMLYVRMSTVMGFTWIFGLASSIVSSFTEEPTNAVCITLHALGLLFIIFNCSQGLFIFFVFVFNKRVGSLYGELFGQITTKIRRQSSTSSSRTSSTVASISETTHF